MKFAAFPDLVEQCRNLATPRECFQMVRSPDLKEFVRTDWHTGYPNPHDVPIKNQVMHNAVMHKFMQHADLKELLLSTATGAHAGSPAPSRYIIPTLPPPAPFGMTITLGALANEHRWSRTGPHRAYRQGQLLGRWRRARLVCRAAWKRARQAAYAHP